MHPQPRSSFIVLHHPLSSFINAVVYLGLEASRGIGWNQLLARAEEEKRASAARKRQGTGLAWRIWVKNSQFQWVIVIGLSMDYHLMDDQSNSNGVWLVFIIILPMKIDILAIILMPKVSPSPYIVHAHIVVCKESSLPTPKTDRVYST